MSLLLSVVAAAAGGQVVLTDIDAASTGSGARTVNVQFRASGQLAKFTTNAGTTLISGQWLVPMDAADAANFEIMATLSSGANPSSGPALGVWHAFTADRVWQNDRASGSAQVVSVLSVQIRRIGTTTVLGTCLATLDIEGGF